MIESRWPDPTPEDDEKPRWFTRALFIAAAAAAAFWVLSHREQVSSFTESFGLHELEAPQIAMPDLRGRSDQPANAPPSTEGISEETLSQAAESMFPDGSSPIVRDVEFNTCINLIDDTATRLGQAPTLVENTANRRVASFKFLEGGLTITCADGAMRIENRG